MFNNNKNSLLFSVRINAWGFHLLKFMEFTSCIQIQLNKMHAYFNDLSETY